MSDSSVRPAELSTANLSELRGKTATSAGWGLTKSGTTPRFLKKIDLKVLTISECNENIEKTLGKGVEVPHHRSLYTNANPPAFLGGVSTQISCFLNICF